MKELLTKQALEINELLSTYINVHNSVFKKTSTFLSLFKRIDFNGILNQIETVLSLFREKREELNNLKSIFDKTTEPDYIMYFHQLQTFFEKLYETVALLKQRQHHLLLISQGEKCSFHDFNAIEKEYQESVEIYTLEGKKLNNINYVIFN